MSSWKVSVQYMLVINTTIVSKLRFTYGMLNPLSVLEPSFIETINDMSMVTQL